MPDFPCARCASVAAAPLTAARFGALVHQQQRLDHRASGSLALVAWAAAGALPASTPPTRRAPIPPSKPSKSAAKSLECATCRVAAQELALAASLVADCAESDVAALLSKLPGAVCEHAAATGLLGHTEARVRLLQPACDAAMAHDRAALLRLLRNTTSLASVASHCNCDGGVLPEWPEALQTFLDADALPVPATLRGKGRAAAALGGAEACAADGGAVDDAAAALLQLAVARSDAPLVKLLCAFGLCAGRAAAPPSEAASEALIDALSRATPKSLRALVGDGGRDELVRSARRMLRFHWTGEAAVKPG